MAVREDQRHESSFEARNTALDIRLKLFELGLRQYGYKGRKMPKQPSNWHEWSKVMSWIGNYYKYMSNIQIINLIQLYQALYGDGLNLWLEKRIF